MSHIAKIMFFLFVTSVVHANILVESSTIASQVEYNTTQESTLQNYTTQESTLQNYTTQTSTFQNYTSNTEDYETSGPANTFVEYELFSLYPGTDVYLSIVNTENLELYLESFEDDKFAVYLSAVSKRKKRTEEELVCNTTTVCSAELPNLDKFKEYFIRVVSLSNDPQHILYDFSNYTVPDNTTNTISLFYAEKYIYNVPKNVSTINIAIESQSNSSFFSAFLVEYNQFFSKQANDLLNNTCINVTNCYYNDIAINSQTSYIVIIENETPENSEAPDNYHYEITYSVDLFSSSDSGSSTSVIVLAVILGVLIAILILVGLVAISYKIYKYRRQNFSVV